MAEYQLYCFAQSGNAYRAALMLNLIGADWEPIFVDFFNGETRGAAYRSTVNEMGEAPVLVHGAKKLTQSGAILLYLAERSGKFLPRNEDERLEDAALDHFRQSKNRRQSRALSLLRNFAKPLGDPIVLEFLKGRATSALAVLDKIVAQPVSSGRRANHRRRLNDELPLLSARGVRLRHRGST